MTRFHNTLICLSAMLLLAQPLWAGPLLHPRGSVKMLDSGVVLDKQMPAPEGMLMACSGQCFIEAGGMMLAGSDQTVFAVREEAQTFHVLVREGQIDFSLRAEAKPVAFQTPFDTLDVRPYLIPADTSAVVSGTLRVDATRAVLTMTQGSLEVVNDQGRQLIHAGNAIVLAQAVTSGTTTTTTTTATFATGGLIVGAGGAALLGGAIALTDQNHDDHDEVSPF